MKEMAPLRTQMLELFFQNFSDDDKGPIKNVFSKKQTKVLSIFGYYYNKDDEFICLPISTAVFCHIQGIGTVVDYLLTLPTTFGKLGFEFEGSDDMNCQGQGMGSYLLFLIQAFSRVNLPARNEMFLTCDEERLTFYTTGGWIPYPSAELEKRHNTDLKERLHWDDIKDFENLTILRCNNVRRRVYSFRDIREWNWEDLFLQAKQRNRVTMEHMVAFCKAKIGRSSFDSRSEYDNCHLLSALSRSSGELEGNQKKGVLVQDHCRTLL